MRPLLRRAGLWLAAVCLVLGWVLTALWALAGRGLASQTAADRWQREQPFSQVSVFFSADAAVNDDAAALLREQIGRTLAGMDLGGAAWTDSFSGELAVSAAAGTNGCEARAICTDGDFFIFHPLVMASGWYYGDQSLSDSLVVLDEPLAWQLFGSSDVTGMPLELDGWPCTVAGVAETPRQADESASYGRTGTVYMSYSLAARLHPGTALTSYEALLPEAVGGFALQTVAGAVTAPESERELIQNTGRFRLGRCLAALRQLPAQVQRTGQVYYPWWENAARAAQLRASLYAGLALAAFLWPCLYGGFWAIRGTGLGIRRLRRAVRQKRGKL